MAKDPTTIEFYRGDTASFHFHREDANGEVIMTRADRIFFTVKLKSKVYEIPYAFQKRDEDFTFDENGEYHFTIEPEDTNDLDFRELYLYDLEVITDGVKTTIASGLLILKTEVTDAANEGD